MRVSEGMVSFVYFVLWEVVPLNCPQIFSLNLLNSVTKVFIVRRFCSKLQPFHFPFHSGKTLMFWSLQHCQSGFSRAHRFGNSLRGFTTWKQKNTTKCNLQCTLSWGPLLFQFDVYPTELTWHVLVRGYLNWLSSCTTWFLNLDDLVKSQEYDYIRILKSHTYKHMPS